ncbi:MAG: hypothetical protein ACTH9H_09930, partial [Galactobacter sp.]
DVVRNTGTSQQQRRRTESSHEAARQESRNQTRPGPTPNAPGRPTYGSGPSQGPRTRSTRSLGGCLVVVIVTVVLFAAGVIPLGKSVMNLFSSGSTGTSNNSGPYNSAQRREADETEQSKRAQARAGEFMEQFIKGDPEAVEIIKQSAGSTYDTRLLTPAQARAAMGADAQWTQNGATVSGSLATVKGFILTPSAKIPVELRLMRYANTWEPSGLRPPVLRSSGQKFPNGTKINGAKVDLGADQSYTTFLVWPGTTTVELPADKFTTYTKPKQTFEATGEISSVSTGSPMSVTVDPKRTAEFGKQAKAAAGANLKTCLSAKTLAPKNCPFGGSVANSVSKVSNVKFTQTVPVKKWELSGSYGSERLWGTGGEVTVSASGWKTTGNGQGHITRITGTWDTFVGEVAVKNGKVVFTAH